MQLDLFTFPKEARKAATVYRFPLCRRADLIRKITADLLSREERAGRKFWIAHIKELRRELRAEGLRGTGADHEIHDYTLAVRAECLSSRLLRASR
ncbi:DUF6074 family protein [Mesorhizobium sp. A623]